MPRRRWGTPKDTSVAMTTHRPLSSAMGSNDDIDWPVHSLVLSSMIYAVFLCDAYHALILVV